MITHSGKETRQEKEQQWVWTKFEKVGGNIGGSS